MSPEQLVCTIEEVETHEQDPTSSGNDKTDPWEAVSTELGDLKDRIADTYRRVADDHGPSEDEIKQAFSTLAGAWDQVAESVTTALRDPDVRDKLKTAASSFASAFGTTMSELGSELKDSAREETGEEE